MVPIVKMREPESLIAFRKHEGARYADMPSRVKKDLIEQLMREQGGLCAYCMRRLPAAESFKDGISRVTIEHWAPQHPEEASQSELELDYRNLFAVCAGGRGSGRRALTCDAAKANKAITVNPVQPHTLASIEYTSEGMISASNPSVRRDLVVTLGLNNEFASLPQ